jgi:surface antigen
MITELEIEPPSIQQVITREIKQKQIEIIPGESEFLRKEREYAEEQQRLALEREKERRLLLARSSGTNRPYVQAETIGYSNLQCVQYAQKRGLGVSGYGNARNYPTNSSSARIGGVVKTSESSAGHLAVVVDKTDSTITIEEANYRRGHITRRTLSINDPRIMGYIN